MKDNKIIVIDECYGENIENRRGKSKSLKAIIDELKSNKDCLIVESRLPVHDVYFFVDEFSTEQQDWRLDKPNYSPNRNRKKGKSRRW